MEPRCKEGPRDWENVFVITRVRYKQNSGITNLLGNVCYKIKMLLCVTHGRTTEVVRDKENKDTVLSALCMATYHKLLIAWNKGLQPLMICLPFNFSRVDIYSLYRGRRYVWARGFCSVYRGSIYRSSVPYIS